MPKYLVERQFEVGQDEMPTVSRRSNSLLQSDFPQITWDHSHVTVDDEGLVKTFCLYVAPDEDSVRRHAERLGLHEVRAVYEIVGDVTPADFPI